MWSMAGTHTGVVGSNPTGCMAGLRTLVKPLINCTIIQLYSYIHLFNLWHKVKGQPQHLWLHKVKHQLQHLWLHKVKRSPPTPMSSRLKVNSNTYDYTSLKINPNTYDYTSLKINTYDYIRFGKYLTSVPSLKSLGHTVNSPLSS